MMKKSLLYLLGCLTTALLVTVVAVAAVHTKFHREEFQPSVATDEDVYYSEVEDTPGFRVDTSTYTMMLEEGDMQYSCDVTEEETSEEGEEMYDCAQAGGRRLGNKYLKLIKIRGNAINDLVDYWEKAIQLVELYAAATIHLTERKGRSTNPNTVGQVLSDSWRARNEYEDLLHLSVYHQSGLHISDQQTCKNGQLKAHPHSQGPSVRGCDKQYSVITTNSLQSVGWLCIDYGPNPTRIYLSLYCGDSDTVDNVDLQPLIDSVHEEEWGGTEWYGIKTIFDAYFLSHIGSDYNYYVWKTRVVADYDESLVDDDDDW